MSQPMYLPMFYLQQKFAMTTNRYELYAANPDGSFGQLMGLAEQKRMAFKEQVTFFSDDTKTRPVFAFKARKAIDLSAGYDVTDEAGQQIGFFRKDFGASLLRSTFHLEGPGYHGDRPGAQPGGRAGAPVHGHPVPADPLRLRRHRRPPAARRRAAGERPRPSTPSTCPTSGSTSGSRPRSRSALDALMQR